MRWEKIGLLWAPQGEAAWASTHATMPVVHVVAPELWYIYLSARDVEGKSRIGRLEVDFGEKLTVRHFDPQPVLSLGEPGTFDDCGVMPSWLVKDGQRLLLYYVGWNVSSTVPYRLSIGLATSDDGGLTFERCSQGPIIDRSRHEPYFATTPCVLKESHRWRMWYTSCTGWQSVLGRPEPAYHVKYAESLDGIEWSVTGLSCVDPGDGFAAARPCVFRRDDGYGMLYSYRALAAYRTDPMQSYRLGYAASADGIHWERLDDDVGIERSADGFDSEMIEYAWIERHGTVTYLLYNGNGFGRTGIGIARLVEQRH